jgi:ATP-dependent DNA ligase
VVDGEIVVPAENGSADFSVLQNELKASSKRIVLVAFDLLYLNGRDIRKLPLTQRKAELKKNHRRHGRSVQRKLRDRGARDLRPRLQAGPRGRSAESSLLTHRQMKCYDSYKPIELAA